MTSWLSCRRRDGGQVAAQRRRMRIALPLLSLSLAFGCGDRPSPIPSLSESLTDELVRELSVVAVSRLHDDGRRIVIRLEPGQVARRDLVVPRAEKAVVVGRILDVDSEQGVEGAFVAIRDTPYNMVTDSLGWFAFPTVESGNHVLEVQHVAYGTQADSVRVPPGATVEITFRVSVQPIALRPIEVHVLSDLELRRRAIAHPHHMLITRDDIDRYILQGAIHVGDVLRLHEPNAVRIRDVGFRGLRVPGVCIESTRAIGSRTFATTDKYGDDDPGCRMVAVVVDGVLVAQASERLRIGEIGDFPLDAIQGMEFLPPTEAIFRYGTFGEDGAVVITTRVGTDPFAHRQAGEEVVARLRHQLEAGQGLTRSRHWGAGGAIGLFTGPVAAIVGARYLEHCEGAECAFVWQSVGVGLVVGVLAGEITFRIRRRQAQQ